MAATKITPLYAETRILLNLLDLGTDPVSKSHFLPQGAAYKEALNRLVSSDVLEEVQQGRYTRYAMAPGAKRKLYGNLANPDMTFFSILGTKTTNGLLKAFRDFAATAPADVAAGQPQQNGAGHHAIDSYGEFAEQVVELCKQLDKEYNLDGLVPIYRVRREIGAALNRDQFDEWLLDLQAEDTLQMMGGDLSTMPQDQKDDSFRVPGGDIRFYVKLL